MNVSLRQLRIFQAVAATRSFTGAGNRVGLSQPAVSRSITELEHQLGLKLLDRTTREVELTEVGRSLAARLERVLEELDAVLLDTRGLASDRQGRVRVASVPTLSANLLPQCIALCRRELPGLELVLLDRIQHDALASVLTGEVDFGVVIDPPPGDDLHCEIILTEPFCAVVPPSHPLARKHAIDWVSLGGEPLVLLDHASGSRRLIDDAMRRQGVDVVVSQEVGHPMTIFRMLEEGLGITVVPRLAIPPGGLGKLRVRPLRPRIDREVVLVRRRYRVLSPVAEVAWDLVRRVAARQTGEARPGAS